MSEKSLKKLYRDECKVENENDITQRIQLLVDREGGPTKFARLVGMSVSGVNRYLDGGDPTSKKLLQIANSLRVNPTWLLTGEGDLEIKTNNRENNSLMHERWEALFFSLSHEDIEKLILTIHKNGIDALILPEQIRHIALMAKGLSDKELKEIFLLVNEAQYCSLTGIPFKPARLIADINKRKSTG